MSMELENEIKIFVNGQPESIPEKSTVYDLLKRKNLIGKFVAVERNQNVVSFREYKEVGLEENDALEIVTLVGGG